MVQNRVELRIYIENIAQQIEEVSSFYREQKLDRSRGIEEVLIVKNLDRMRKVSKSYQADKDHKEFGTMDWAIYREVSRETQKSRQKRLILRSCRVGIELSIESPEERISRRRNTQDECNQDNHQSKHSKSMLNINKHNLNSRCKAFLDQNTLNKFNQILFQNQVQTIQKAYTTTCIP